MGKYEIKTIKEIANTQSGGTPSRKIKEYYIGDIPWVKSGELQENIITETEEKITQTAIDKSSAKRLPINTLLVAMYGANVGRVAILGIEAATNQAICAIQPKDNRLSTEYLYYYFIYYKNQLLHKAFGGAQKNISQQVIKNLEIPVPTIEDQKQIVSRIKECFTLLDKSEEKLKQAIEKSNKIAKSFLHRAYVKSIANHHSCTLKDACTRITDGSHFSPKTIPSGYPYITVRDLNEVGIDFQNCRMISKESYTNLVKLGCKPEYGDVLFSKDGTVGKVAKVPENKDFVVLSSLAIITPNKEMLSTNFLELLLNTPEVLNQAIKKKTGTAIRRITLTNLKEITIPIPPIQIQNDIYTEYIKYQMIGKKNMSFLIRSRDRIELLRQSILKKAFEGKLI